MSVRVSTVKRGKHGELLGVVTTEVSAAEYARQQAEKRHAAELRTAASHKAYEATRDLINDLCEVLFAVCEGRPSSVIVRSIPYDKGSSISQSLQAIILARMKHALAPTPSDWKGARRMVDYIDARIALHLAHFKERASKISPQTPVASGDGVPLGTYRFVWKAGEAYARGDVVTDRASPWICLTPSLARPGTTKDWRLLGRGDLDTDRKHKGATYL